MEEKQKSKIRKENIKIFPNYQMIGFDLMFYLAISLMFYTQVKHISASEVVLLDTFYAFFSMAGHILASVAVIKIGKKNSMIFGGICNVIGISTILFGNIYAHFIIANLIIAIGYAFKGVAEPAFLQSTVAETDIKEKSNICTRIQEKGYSRFSYFSAITMFAAGFMYDISPYIPVMCCLICLVITVIIASQFTEVEEIEKTKEEKAKENKEILDVFKELALGFKFVIRSKRLRALIIMINFMYGIFALITTYRLVLLEDIKCSVALIGAVVAAAELVKGIFATTAYKFHKKYRNKSMTFLAVGITISMIVAGLVTLIPYPYYMQLNIVVFSLCVMYALKGIEQVLYKRYYANFTNGNILPKIYAIDGIVAGLSKMLITFIGAVILNYMNIKYAMVIVGCVLTLVALMISKYMKNRTGLKPEEYDKKDIMYN